MTAASHPGNEEERISSLRSRNILDSEGNQCFNDVIDLVRDLLQVPIAMISLVDTDRQWLMTKQGLDIVETPRDVSFCGHTILEIEPMVIENSLLDVRFRDNPLVRGEPHVRFYIGVPLIDSQGCALGALCAIDTIPRTARFSQIHTLRSLARLVVSMIESKYPSTATNKAASERDCTSLK